MAHSTGSGTISFGLVSIPVKFFSATASQGISFNLLHAKCGARIKQQTFCPVCNEVSDRSTLVRGYEFAKEQYVRVADEELKALEGEASSIIDIQEFVPLSSVDPVYFDKAYYLGPDKGAEKAYSLLLVAMGQSQRAALATFVMRGKETPVLIRALSRCDVLMLHTLYFADEVRSAEPHPRALVKKAELDLALELLRGLASEGPTPEKYQDTYRQRVLALVNSKVEGKAIAVAPAVKRAPVPDIMEALKQSLAKAEGRVKKGKK